VSAGSPRSQDGRRQQKGKSGASFALTEHLLPPVIALWERRFCS
jgi:hypothetical protein